MEVGITVSVRSITIENNKMKKSMYAKGNNIIRHGKFKRNI